MQFVQLDLCPMNSTTVSCHCACETCVCGSRVRTISVATEPLAEVEKGEQLPMSGDVSSTDIVSSGFGFGFGGQASLKPAEVALVTSNNPFNSTNFIRDAITHESLRAEIKSVDAKVTGVAAQLTASEARNMQAQIDQLRADKSAGLLAQILAAVSKTSTV